MPEDPLELIEILDHRSGQRQYRVMDLFEKLEEIRKKPEPFERYTSLQLWNDEHISKGMLEAHLDPDSDAASQNRNFIDKSVSWMMSRFGISDASTVIDFGCGPGLYTTRFAGTGATVTGVDFSERSIRHARETAEENRLKVDYVLQDYLEFSTDRRFDLVIMIGWDFSVLGPKQRRSLLGTFNNVLAEDGSILLDVDSMVRFHNTKESNTKYRFSTGGFMSSVPHHIFRTTYKYEQQHVLLDKELIVEQNRELELFYWTQCYSLQTLEREFADNGLEIVESYSDMVGTTLKDDSPGIAVVAKKAT
jgi:SAM-dependent methyltransferase